MSTDSLHIAVIGGGVAGITVAHILQRQHHVTLIEKNGYIGGHTNTIVVNDARQGDLPIDTGFIVLNNKTYPLLHRLLQQLKVAVRDSDMSFGFYCPETNLQYSGSSFAGLFADRKNYFNPSHYRLLWHIYRFSRSAATDLEDGALEGRTLGQYIQEKGYPSTFVDHYLLPMGAAIWSTPSQGMLDFPAETFFRFCKNHGLLSLQDRPQWQTVQGGSFTYVKAFLRQFKGTVMKGIGVKQVRREAGRVEVRMEDGAVHPFDKVVLASHADQSLQLLADPSPEESAGLGAWRYNHNPTVLHTDTEVLPPNRRAWASWNYYRNPEMGGEARLSVTYHMNRLQGIESSTDYLVTLNPARPIRPDCVLREIDYTHPLYTFEAIQSQPRLAALNGKNNTYFCGSYFGYGFHEDAVRSGVAVAESMGLAL